MKSLAAKGWHLISLGVTNFPNNNPYKECIEGYGIRDILHDDAKIPEDRFDYVGTTTTRSVVKYIIPMEFSDPVGYYPVSICHALALFCKCSRMAR